MDVKSFLVGTVSTEQPSCGRDPAPYYCNITQPSTVRQPAGQRRHLCQGDNPSTGVFFHELRRRVGAKVGGWLVTSLADMFSRNLSRSVRERWLTLSVNHDLCPGAAGGRWASRPASAHVRGAHTRTRRDVRTHALPARGRRISPD